MDYKGGSPTKILGHPQGIRKETVSLEALQRPSRILDVARAAGVSAATVSRALSAPDSVRPETRERVMESVRRLNYTPNEAARTLRAGAARMALVAVPHRYSGAFFAGVVNAIDAEL